MSQRAAVILAAGQGTRMRSPTPKVLHAVGGRALLDRAIDTAQALGCERIVVVAGAHAPQVAERARARLGAQGLAIQDPPLGTGHAVRAAEAALAGFEGDVVVTYADTPLLDAGGVAPLFDARARGADVAVLGFEAAHPAAYGRLIMDDAGGLLRIVEARDANHAELQVRRCNSGVLAAPAALLFSLLAEVTNDNANREYYLTDVIGLARKRRLHVRAVFTEERRVLGVNSQAELAAAEAVFQQARRTRLLAEGIAMPAPETVMLAWDTEIAPGAVVEPYVVFGPGVRVETGAQIRAFSHLEGAMVREGAIIGPYARLRPGADIGPGAHIGNFVEVKKVQVGAGAKANHLSYLGDGSVGPGANIGAGVIFCNYDGFTKADTHVGARAFIGSDTALVAPVRVGDGAYIGSGSVIVRDVEPDALALARGQQVEKPGWADRFPGQQGSKTVSAEQQKRAAGEAAAALVEHGMVVGLGTGSTAAAFIEALGARARTETLSLRCVATSKATEALAKSLGLPLLGLDEVREIDLTVDGADEVGPGLALIKGGGAALLREKLVWEASRRCVVVADSAKRVKRLGAFPLPVEVVAFGHAGTARRLCDALAECDLGAAPSLRVRDGQPVVTDGGGLIYDIACGSIPDPSALAEALKSVTGVIDHGLFLDLADQALIGTDAGVEQVSP